MKKIIREMRRFYSKITDFLFLTQNFHKYQMIYSGSYSNSYKLKKEQYCLIHPPKSAGSSLNVHLKRNNIFIYESAHCLVSKYCSPEEYKYIIVIRNPIKRLKSFYEMQRNNKKLAFHRHSKKGLSYFIEKLEINHNCLCKFVLGNLNEHINDENYLKAEKNLSKFWFKADFDNLKEDVEILSKKLNISSNMEHEGKKVNVNRTELSNKDVDVIKKFNTYDLNLYNYFINNLKK